jgi:hypothetical protein
MATIEMAARNRISEFEPADGINHARLRLRERAQPIAVDGTDERSLHLDGQPIEIERAVTLCRLCAALCRKTKRDDARQPIRLNN